MRASSRCGAALGAAVVLGLALGGCGHRKPAAANRGGAPAPPSTVTAAAEYPTITAIHAMGTRRYNSAEVARASGLRPGQRYTPATVRAAEERLAATGAFTEINSLLVPSDNGRIVDFELTDNPHFFPVRFVGFEGWSAARLRAAVHPAVPLFTGQLPLLRQGLARQVRGALQRLAAAQHWPGQVRMELSQMGGGEVVVFRLQ